jgi:hypothetical protein
MGGLNLRVSHSRHKSEFSTQERQFEEHSLVKIKIKILKKINRI